MIKFKNINGDVFLAVGSVKRKSALNGEKSLSATITQGDDVLNKIDKGWSLEFDNEPYVVTYFERNDNNNTVEIDAIHKFFWDMTKSVLYNSYSNSHVARFYLDEIFKDTGYTYALNFDPKAFEKENWGMKNKLSLFNDAISSMGAEFEINGTLISIFKNVGSDLSTIVRHGFNLSDMTLENDNANFATYGEGFGAYDDKENQKGPRLHVTYTSPLAKAFGKLHAEPIVDERYTVKDNLLSAVKDKVDSSFAVSVKLSLYDLTAAGYPYKMANVGDWLLAVDEHLDFKQKIRIISVDDEFAEDGTRISYTVTCGDVGVTKKYQDANAALTQKVQSAYENAQTAKDAAIQAVISSTSKNTIYDNIDGEENLPKTANEGDLAFVQTGDGKAMYIYTKLPDGSFKWVKRLDPDTGEQIAAGVEEAIATANKHTDELNEKQASEAAAFQSEANVALSSAAAERADMFKQSTSMATSAATHADSMANSAAAYGKAQAASALSSANSALTTAKSDLTDDISVAKSEAIEAAKTADGVVKKQITDTADSINLTISQNKSDADGKIKTAQTAATQALDGLKAKVDQTTYDTKTGQLDKAVGSATLTADSAALSIKNYQSTVDGKFSSQAAAITANSKAIDTKVSQTNFDTVTGDLTTKYGNVKTTADAVTTEVTKYETANDKKVSENTASINALNNQITSKVNQTDFDKTTGDLSGKYSVQQQTINSISQTVTELQAKANTQGQVNQLMNTEFTPDLQGWITDSTDGSKVPYRSYARGGAGSITVGFNSTAARSGSTIRLIQTVILGSSTDRVVSLKWLVRTLQNNNYDNVRLLFRDSNNSDISDVYRSWADTSLDGTWHEIKWENITVPDNASTVNLYFQAREGTRAYLNKPMLVFANTIGDYVPGNYNNNARVTALELDVDGIHGLVDDPSKGLSATWNLASDGQSIAVQAKTAASTADGKAVAAQKDATTAITTANGTQTTVNHMQGDISDIQSTQTQTAGQVTTEIEDRKNGDNTTRTQLTNLIDQRVTSVEKGYQSYFDQKADGILLGVGTPNMLVNSDFNPDLSGWSVDNFLGGKKPYRSYFDKTANKITVGFNTQSDNASMASLSQKVALASTPGARGTISLSWQARTSESAGTQTVSMSFVDSSGNTIGKSITADWSDKGTGWNIKKIEGIDIPDKATSLTIAFVASEKVTAYLTKPMLSFTNKAMPYMPGSATNSSTVLQLFKDNWSIGLADNLGKITSGIVADNNNMALINKNITLQGNTTVTADFYAKGGNFKNLNASNITTGTINAAKINVINLDVSSLSGNITNFIKSYWSDAYSNQVVVNANNVSFYTNSHRSSTVISEGQIDMTVYNNTTKIPEHIGGLKHGTVVGRDNQDYLIMYLDGWKTQGGHPADAAKHGGDGFMFSVSDGWNIPTGMPLLTWENELLAGGAKHLPGWHFWDHTEFHSDVMMFPNGAYQGLYFGATEYNGTTYPGIFGNQKQDDGPGILFGSTELYFLYKNTVYPLSVVLKAASGGW
ncbi:phage tail protein [Weissella sagaensis]|uniref:Phage tail protein n=1 Tax=Weissella sagaensis TaxID=2559928 RepID=A0ABW1RRQ5_9LACO|nr:phage tail protein [Weissella sagaensis]